MDRATATIITQSKSLAAAVVLALFFGGLGLFYASVPGGTILTVIAVVIGLLAIPTLGLALALLPVLHLVAVIWAVVAVQEHNKRLVAGLPTKAA